MENLAYVLAPAQVVSMRTAAAPGATHVRRPWGQVLARQAEGSRVLGELDAAHLRQLRSQLPALEHRVL